MFSMMVTGVADSVVGLILYVGSSAMENWEDILTKDLYDIEEKNEHAYMQTYILYFSTLASSAICWFT